MSSDVRIEYTSEPDPLGYVREKLFLAITDMAESTESRLPNRLIEAFSQHLVVLSQQDFRDDLRPAFEAIQQRATGQPEIWDEGRISASIGPMAESECKRLIAVLVQLFGDVCAARGR